MNKECFLSVIIRHRFAKHVFAASVISLVAACGGGSTDTASTPPPVLPTVSIKQIFDATVDMAGSQPAAMQGMSVGLQTDDGQTWLRGVGFKDNAKKLPTDPQSQYRIGSLTKSFTSTAVLQLVDQGFITLDKTVLEILPEMAKVVPNASAITLRNLLEMRSGLTDYLCQESLNYPGLGASVFDEWFESISYGVDPSYTPAQLVQASVQQKYMCGTQTPQPPRDVFDYANVNYVLAAMMAEKASCSSSKGCQKIESLINDGIIKKLGMTRTTFVTDSKFSTSNFAQASASGVDVTFIGPKVPWAAGAIISVPEEELLWGRELALNSSKLLSDSSHQLRKSVKPGGLMGNIPTSYGMGTYNLVSSGTGTTDLFGHSGAIATWTTSVFYSPSLKMGFSINMTNSGSTASWFPTYGAGSAYGGVLKSKFNPQTMLWSLERNIRLAVENSGTCSTLGPAVGNGAGGNCSGDSVRTSALNVAGGALVINPSGKTFNQANIITTTNANSWTGFDATIQNSPVDRPSLSFFGNSLTGVTIGDSGKVTLPNPSVVESTGLGSAGFTLTGNASELTLGGTVLSMGANTVAVQVMNSAVASKVNVSSTANIQGDIVLSGDVTVQIDGKVDGKVVINGTKVKLLGSGKITGCIQYATGATLAAGSMTTSLACPDGQVKAIADKPSRKFSPQLWFY
jgi:D-alanyl-D-alanine carboxypeptidase